jgi:hypothetical protein
MNKDNRVPFPLSALLWFTLVASLFLAWLFIPSPLTEDNLVPVLVASRDLGHKSELTSHNVEINYYPSNLVPDGVVTDLSMVECFVLTTRVRQGGFVFLADVADPKTMLVSPIPPGHKVFNVRIEGGNLDPTLRNTLNAEDSVSVSHLNPETKELDVVLCSAKIFNINGTTKRQSGKVAIKGTAILGLIVTEAEAEKLADARRLEDRFVFGIPIEN